MSEFNKPYSKVSTFERALYIEDLRPGLQASLRGETNEFRVSSCFSLR